MEKLKGSTTEAKPTKTSGSPVNTMGIPAKLDTDSEGQPNGIPG